MARTNKTSLGIEVLMLAQIVDAVKALQFTTAGKKPKKEAFISKDFMVKEADSSEAFKQRIIRKRALEKLLK